MAFYKIVDERDADAVASGSIKIGTAQTYAKLEGPRRDELDSNRIFEFRTPAIFDGSPRDSLRRAAALRTGIRVAPGATVIISNSSGNRAPKQAYLYCLTTDYLSQVQPGQAVFKVAYPKRLASIASSLDPRLGSFEIRRVEYDDIRADAMDLSVQPSPFVKGEDFASELEVRVAFRPSGTFNPEGFIIDHTDFARCFERIM